MLELYEWEKEQVENSFKRNGEWRDKDFYGPFCKLEVKKDKDSSITVYPHSVTFEGAENSIGDYNIFIAMTKELFAELGKYTIYIPMLGKYLEIDAVDTEKALLEVLKTIPLI